MVMKLIVDYPIKYAHLPYGDGNFVLAPLYKSNKDYKKNINKANTIGRDLMLDNGAWEFGKSMDVKEYCKIIYQLQPMYAVIPDALKNKELSKKLTLEFFDVFNRDKAMETSLIYAPQGGDIEEMIDSYNESIHRHATAWLESDILGIPKHVGELMNRVTFTDILYDHVKIKFKDVHFLGYWNWKELMTESICEWKLHSMDTKAPVKYSFHHDFVTQMDYYDTPEILDLNSLKVAINAFQERLGKCNL